MKHFMLGVFAFGIVSFFACDTVNKTVNKIMNKPTKATEVAVVKPNTFNGKWRLKYITGPRIAFDGLYPKEKPFIVFDSTKSQVSGSTGCNTFTGPFTLVGDSIVFKDLATTMKMCVDGAQGETIFLRTINMVTHYRVKEDTLWLRYKNIDAMRFVRDTTTTRL